MARLIAFIVVLGVSGLPAGSLLCALSCAPEAAVEPICHKHGATTDGQPTMTGVHLCDEDPAAVPMIASPGFSNAVASSLVPHSQHTVLVAAPSAVSDVWGFPPGRLSRDFAASPSILRI